MLDIDEMNSKEIQELLHQVGYGHLGCIHEGKPYVMPMSYYLEDSDIYLFTTEGMKTHDIDANPDINRTWIDALGRSEKIAIYRIDVSEMSGRTTDGVSSR